VSRWRRTKTVATFEFLSTVKRRGYLITTFGMPVFIALYAAVLGVPAYFMTKQANKPSSYGVVDPGGVLRLKDETTVGSDQMPEDLRRALAASGQQATVERMIGSARSRFRPYATEADARAALVAQTIKGYFVLPPDYLQKGGVDAYGPDTARLSNQDGRGAFEDLLRQHLLAGRVDGSTAARILAPVSGTRRFAVTPKGEVVDGGGASTVVRIVVPVAFMILFLLSVLMTSGFLLQGTATEKENKVVDVLLASANPDEVLAGKLLGLGAAGLLQVAIWLSVLMVGGVGILPLLIATHVEVPWIAVLLALPLFIASFLFFGSLMMGSGSLGSNMREAQQLAMVWSLTAALPMMMIGPLIQDPHGTVARVLTWIPITSAAVVMLRASMDAASLAWWEAAGAFVVLAASTWLAIRIGARLFRIGILTSGARPSFKEIIRQARLS
jgi:ABC-2 type transport system permease protein